MKSSYSRSKIRDKEGDRLKSSTKEIALCSLFAGFAVALLCLGGVFFIGLFICPMIASLFILAAREEARREYAWSCFIAAAILGMLLCPDKECAGLFMFLGWYPLAQPAINKIGSKAVRILIKSSILIVCVTLLYTILIFVLGLTDILGEMSSAALWMDAVMVLMGAVLFYMFDKICARFTVLYRIRRKKK